MQYKAKELLAPPCCNVLNRSIGLSELHSTLILQQWQTFLMPFISEIFL